MMHQEVDPWPPHPNSVARGITGAYLFLGPFINSPFLAVILIVPGGLSPKFSFYFALFDFVVLAACYASTILVPAKDRELVFVERMRKCIIIEFMYAFWKLAIFDVASDFLTKIIIILGFATPIIAPWFMGLPHFFASNYPEGWEDHIKHAV